MATFLELAEVFSVEAADIIRELEQVRREVTKRHAAALAERSRPD